MAALGPKWTLGRTMMGAFECNCDRAFGPSQAYHRSSSPRASSRCLPLPKECAECTVAHKGVLDFCGVSPLSGGRQRLLPTSASRNSENSKTDEHH